VGRGSGVPKPKIMTKKQVKMRSKREKTKKTSKKLF
jgi:hypothetical protein